MTDTQDVMPTLPSAHSDGNVEGWANASTAEVAYWLTDERTINVTRRLVYAWNDGGGLGVDLADELHDFIRIRLAASMRGWFVNRRVRRRLRNVNWNQLAEQYALLFCGITEVELTERRESLLQ